MGTERFFVAGDFKLNLGMHIGDSDHTVPHGPHG